MLRFNTSGCNHVHSLIRTALHPPTSSSRRRRGKVFIQWERDFQDSPQENRYNKNLCFPFNRNAMTPVDFQDEFDIVVVGAGHSGCEAARLGCRTYNASLV
jgi:hypothetical protein